MYQTILVGILALAALILIIMRVRRILSGGGCACCHQRHTCAGGTGAAGAESDAAQTTCQTPKGDVPNGTD